VARLCHRPDPVISAHRTLCIGEIAAELRNHFSRLSGCFGFETTSTVSMSTLSDNAVAKFQSGYNCAQSVLHAACERLSFDHDTALRLSCGFGGGMANKQQVCGAVAGGIIALGLKCGRGENEELARAEVAYKKIHTLIDRFQTLHGSVNCKELLGGCDFKTEEGKRLFKEKNLKQTTCTCCVASAATILEELL
jgi:C_GCAxxG_C_C family probable redox protein